MTLGIAQFAKAAGVEEGSARVMLRKIGHKREGRSYEFKSQDEMKKLIAKARAAGPATPAKKKAKKATPKKKAPAKKKPKPAKKKVVKKKPAEEASSTSGE